MSKANDETKQLVQSCEPLANNMLPKADSSYPPTETFLSKVKNGDVTWGSIWLDLQTKEQKRHEDVWNATLAKYCHKFARTIGGGQIRISSGRSPPRVGT
jgi:hypothetical protein